MIRKALSVRAPWWWFILHAAKDVENRDWSTNFRGTVYVHASKWWSLVQVAIDALASVRIAEEARRGRDLPPAETTYRAMRAAGGCIVGQVDIVGCVSQSNSPWFFGKFGFVLANPVAYATPVPCKGSLGLFNVPDEVLAQLPVVELAPVAPGLLTVDSAAMRTEVSLEVEPADLVRGDRDVAERAVVVEAGDDLGKVHAALGHGESVGENAAKFSAEVTR